MKSILFILFTMLVGGVYSQSTLPLRADTVVIERVGGNANFKLKDASRDTLGGILTNIGNGVYRGKKPRKLNDSMFVIGLDTITISAGETIGANNGLTKSGSDIQLGSASYPGSALTNQRYIDADVHGILINRSNASGSEIPFQVYDDGGVGAGAVNITSVNNPGLNVSSTNQTAVGITSTNGIGAQISSTNNVAASFIISPSSTNTSENIITLYGTTPGTAANGFGLTINMNLQSAGGFNSFSNSIVSKWTNATNRTSMLEFYGSNSGTQARKAALAGNGQWTWPEYPGLTHQTDTTTYKPIAYDGSGNIVPMANWAGSGGGAGDLDAVLALGGRLSANRFVSMGHKPWDNDSAALRLRNVDSVALRINLAKAGRFMEINKPEGVDRTYAGSFPYEYLMESTTDSDPAQRNNPYKKGWNVNGARDNTKPGLWWSSEPNYRPASQQFFEEILELYHPNGSIHNVRPWMMTMIVGDSVRNTLTDWAMRGTTWRFTNLADDIGYVSMGQGTLNVNNTTAASTNFSISNGPDIGGFDMAPGTGILDYAGTNFQISGELNTFVHNGSSTGRAGIRFIGDGGTTAYLIKYNSLWAAQTDMRNAIALAAVDGLTTSLALKADGTAWLGDILAYTSGSQKVNLSGTIALRGCGKVTTAPEILVRTSDSTVRAMDTSAFRAMMGIGSVGASITSVNGMTGPAITISNGTAINTSSGSNDVLISFDRTNSDVPHTLATWFTDVNNSGTSETDLYTTTVGANKLISNAQSIHFVGTVSENDITATTQIKVFFAGIEVANTGAISISSVGFLRITGEIIRATSTTARASFKVEGAGLATDYVNEFDLTGLDFTTGNIFKVTGTAGGASGGSNDITAKSGKLTFQSN